MTDDIANGAQAPLADMTEGQAQFMVEKIYVKDLSFEVPGAPGIFNADGENNLGMNMQHQITAISETAFEVVLHLTLNCQQGESTVYLAEVKQAGVFTLTGFDQQGVEYLLSTQAPTVLYPYARQIISDLIQSGGFPPFLLQPINFEGLYMDAMRQREMESQGDLAADSGEPRHLDS